MILENKRVAVACLTACKWENEGTAGEKKDLCPGEMASKMVHILRHD